MTDEKTTRYLKNQLPLSSKVEVFVQKKGLLNIILLEK